MEHLNPLELVRDEFEKDSNRNVFVMMRYAKQSVLDEIEQTIKETLHKYNLKAILARDVVFDAELWSNIRFCMEHSRYGIAVFDRVKQPDFSPNVTLELGYMLALKKPTLILKEYNIPVLNTDIVNHIYTPFDPYDIENSITTAIADWLTKLGHSKFRSAEIITAENTLEANKARTKAIVNCLDAIANDGKTHIIRQAASMSSVAISESERQYGDSDGSYQALLLMERSLIIQELNKGLILRLIISPKTQLDLVEMGLVSKKYIVSNIIPRYDTLISFIESHIDNERLQVVYTLRLPHDNLMIIDDNTTFVGRKRRRERGFPYTTQIFDPAVIAEEIDEFDAIFSDSIGVLLHTDITSERSFSLPEVKHKVIQELHRCKNRLEEFCRKQVRKRGVKKNKNDALTPH